MSLRLASFYAVFFLFGGIQFPFWPLWLQSRGLSAADIGVLLFASTLARLAGQTVTGQAADRRGERRTVLVGVLVAAFAASLLYLPAHGFWPVLAVALATAFVLGPVLPLTEGLTVVTAQIHGLDYGRIRLWGSIAFIAGTFAGGWLLTGRSPDVILWMVLVGLAISTATAAFLPDTRTPPAGRRLAPAVELLKDRRFLVFLAVAGLLQASHAAYYGFSSLHWRAAGLSETLIGALWAEGVIAEVVLFVYSGRLLARIGPIGMLALGGAAGLVRWTVMGTSTTLAPLFAVQWLHAFTFAASHAAAMYFLAQAVPRHYSATAQGLYSGLGSGMLLGLAMIVSGRLYEAAESGAFLAMAGLSAMALVLLMVLAPMWRAVAAQIRPAGPAADG